MRTFSLLIAHATGEVCDSRLDIYLVVFVLREVLCLPLVIYQFMNPETAPSTRTATTAQATALSPANVPTAPVVSAASAPVRSANSNIMSVGAAEQPNTPLDQTSSDHSAVDGNQLSTAASALPSSLSSHPHLFSSATSAGHPKLLAAAVSAASSNSSAAIQSQISTEQHHGQLHHQPQQQQELQQQQQLRPKQINGSNNSSSSSPTRSSRYRRRTPKAKNARLAGHINRLKSVLDMFGILWFIVGNWLVFTSSSKCIAVPRDGGGGGGGAALLYRCSVAFLGIGYVLVCVPIVLFLGIVFCLPVVLVWSKVMRGLASPGGWSRVPASSHAGGYGYGYAGGASGGAGGGNAGGGYGYGGGYYNGGSNGGSNSNSNNTSSFGSTGGGAAWQRDDDDDGLGAPDAVIRTFPVLVYRGGGGGGSSGSNSADAPIDKKRSSGFADPLLNAWAVPMGAAAHHSGVESRRSKSVAANSNSTSSSGSAGGFVATLYERVLSDVRRSIDSGSAAGQWSVSADRRSRGAPDGGRQGRYSYAEVDGGADEYDNSG
ncbi:hypothetical protein HDU84_005561 [Entophlyctis sp. JEL0112]|nr:hypothetical protein HDU84_005561 [Entophlyctis sp. JEL0112]